MPGKAESGPPPKNPETSHFDFDAFYGILVMNYTFNNHIAGEAS